MITINETMNRLETLEKIGTVIYDQNFTGRTLGRVEIEMMKDQLSEQYYRLQSLFAEFNKSLSGSTEEWGKDEMFLMKTGAFRYKMHKHLKERSTFHIVFRIAQLIRAVEWIASRHHYRLKY